ncbi:MAG: tetratricopeptide repeat protein, partial [Anaerolineales bacterium]
MASLNMDGDLLTTTQVLDRISAIIPAQDFPGMLEKMLRVPVAWDALHNISLLEAVCSLLPSKSLSPALVAAVCMDLEELPAADLSLEDEVEANIDQVWEQAHTNNTPPDNLYQTALLAIALDRESQRAGAAADIAHWSLDNPLVWRASLACNWFEEPLKSEIVNHWLAKGVSGFSLAAWVLLSNHSTDETARLLIESGAQSPVDLIQKALQVGETKLAASISRHVEQTNLPAKAHSLDGLLTKAMGSIARGAGVNAKSALGTAWEMTSKLAGDVADWIAITAERDNDPIVAAEAWNQALEIQPQPYRRARLALCLHQCNRSDEALDLISADSGAPEELIALGTIQAQHAQQTASDCLTRAARSINNSNRPQPFWLLKLVDALTQLGETNTALSHISLLTDWHPPAPELFTHIGELYLMAGELEQAIAAAHIANRLNPTHEAAHVLLGRSFDAAEEYTSAVQIWEQMAETNPDYRLDLASALLNAEEPEKALQAAMAFLEDHPASITPKSIVGRALIQLGQPKEAVQFLQEAVASAPNSPRAWLALAACQNALEDHEAEQKTLQSGLEAIPDAGELHYRLAQIYFDNDQLELAQKHINDSIDCDQEPSASSFALQADILERLDLPKDALRARESA